MTNTADQIALINEHLRLNVFSDNVFAGARYHGIVSDAVRTEDDKNIVIYPVVYDLSGEGETVSIDDHYPMTIYHRLISKSYTNLSPNVGDRQNKLAEKTEVKMIVSASTSDIDMTQDMLECMISRGMPDVISTAQLANMGLLRMQVMPVSVQYDSLQIWRDEYKGLQICLTPTQILLAIRYTIQSERMHCIS